MFRHLLNTSVFKLVSAFGALSFSWVVSLLLPISEAGRFFAVLAIIPGIAVILGFGVDQTVLRLGAARFSQARSPEDAAASLAEVLSHSARSILKRTAIAALFIAVGGAALLLLLPDRKDALVPVLWALLLAPFYAALPPTVMGFRVQGRYRRSVVGEHSSAMAFAAVALLLLTLVFSADFAVAYGAYGFFLVLLSVPLFSKTLSGQRAPIDHDRQFGITQLAQYFLYWGVIGQVSFFAAPEEVAVLSLSMQVVIAINMILIIIDIVNGHKISSLIQSGRSDELRQLLRDQSPYLVFIGIGAALAIGVLAPWAYGFLGPDYAPAVTVTWILIAGQLVVVLTGPAPIMLNMSGNARIVSRITIAIGFPVTALVWPFYQLGGMYGIATLVGLSAGLVSLTLAICATRASGIRPIWPSRPPTRK